MTSGSRAPLAYICCEHIHQSWRGAPDELDSRIVRRQVRGPREDPRGRHGRHLHGAPPPPGRDPHHQGHAAGGRRERRPAQAVPARGADGHPLEAREHRRLLRLLRRRRRHRLHGHGVHRRDQPAGHDPQLRPAPDPAGDPSREAEPLRARLPSPEGDRPPGHLARQHHDDAGGGRHPPRQADRPRDREARARRGAGAADGGRRVHRQAALLLPGAAHEEGELVRDRRPERPLLLRRRPVRGADGRLPVRRRKPPGHPDGALAEAADAVFEERSGRESPRGAARDPLEGAPEEPRRPMAERSGILEGARGAAVARSPQRTRRKSANYVKTAVEFVRAAALAQNPAGASLQKTLQSKFRVSEVSIRPLEATDMHVQRTLSRMERRRDAERRLGARRPAGAKASRPVVTALAANSGAGTARRSPDRRLRRRRASGRRCSSSSASSSRAP